MNLNTNSIFAYSSFRMVRLAAAGLSLLVARSSQAGLIETVEAPRVQTSSASNTTTIDFNNLDTGYRENLSVEVSKTLTAEINGKFFINRGDKYGGAVDPSNKDQSSNYLSVPSGDVTMKLSESQAYFGLWISASDKFNQIAFFNGDKQVGSLTGASDLLTALPKEYLGNPTPDFLGKDGPDDVPRPENFVFVNFYAETKEDEFNRIVLSNAPDGGTAFESDNFTFSVDLQAPSAVPEPSSFALLGLGGLGLAISTYRRRFNKAV